MMPERARPNATPAARRTTMVRRGSVALGVLWVLAIGVLAFFVIALASHDPADTELLRAQAAEALAQHAVDGSQDAGTINPAGGLDGHTPTRETALWRFPAGGRDGGTAAAASGPPAGTDGIPLMATPTDPAGGPAIGNWCGLVGAWIAYQGYGHLGVGVWLPIVLAGVWLVLRAGGRRPPGLAAGGSLALVLFVLIGIVGFDIFDPPGRLASPMNAVPGNWGGRLGAVVSWELLYALGPGIVLGLTIFAGYAVAALRDRTPRHLSVRIAGVLLMVAAVSGIRYVFWPAAGPFPEGSGGLLPMALAEVLMDRFNPVGTAIILAVAFCLGALVAVDEVVLGVPRYIVRVVRAIGRVPVGNYAGRMAAAGAGLGRGAGAMLSGTTTSGRGGGSGPQADERARRGRQHDLDEALDDDGIPIAGSGGGGDVTDDARDTGSGGVMRWLRRVWWRDAADDVDAADAIDEASGTGGEDDGAAGHGRHAALRVNGRSMAPGGRGGRGGRSTAPEEGAETNAISPDLGGIGGTTSFDLAGARSRPTKEIGGSHDTDGGTKPEITSPGSDARAGAAGATGTSEAAPTAQAAGVVADSGSRRGGGGGGGTSGRAGDVDMAALREKIRLLPVNGAARTNQAQSQPGSAAAQRAAAEEDLPRTVDYSSYQFPTLDLLAEPEATFSEELEEYVREQAVALEHALQTYNIDGKVVGIDTGPVITMYEIELAPGTKVASINSISSDIARSLRAQNIRIVPNIPGKNTIGIEVPNLKKEKVRLVELMAISSQATKVMRLPMFLGKDASGGALTADLTAMPHMLIAGTTGSGKSVCMNSILMSFLYTKRPDELKLILVDPKMVELSMFKDVPHLMCPVVTEMDKAAAILEWGVTKMEERYELLAEAGVRDIATYNGLTWEELKERFEPANEVEEAKIPKKLPYIVFVIDELADLIMTHKEVETSIVRIAQKARAVGIHLILATQRPQANVVTGLIKSNMPCRISFKVASGMDSRIVLDHKGAELLLGQGDMLFLGPHSSELVRAQGTLVADGEIRKVVRFLKKVAAPSYERQLMTIRARIDEENEGVDVDGVDGRERDPLFCEAVDVIVQSGRGSVSLLQRRLAIGYTRSSRLIDQMGLAGIIGEHRGSQAREVLITPEEWEQMRAMMEAEEAADTLFARSDEEEADMRAGAAPSSAPAASVQPASSVAPPIAKGADAEVVPHSVTPPGAAGRALVDDDDVDVDVSGAGVSADDVEPAFDGDAAGSRDADDADDEVVDLKDLGAADFAWDDDDDGDDGDDAAARRDRPAPSRSPDPRSQAPRSTNAPSDGAGLITPPFDVDD